MMYWDGGAEAAEVYHILAIDKNVYNKDEVDSIVSQKTQVQIITWEAED